MKRSVLLAVIALVGLVAMHGVTAHHNPAMPDPVVSSSHAGMGMPSGMDHHTDGTHNGGLSMTELCLGILTALVGVLLLGIGIRRSSRVAGAVEPHRPPRFAWARAGPRRAPSIAELCVSRT